MDGVFDILEGYRIDYEEELAIYSVQNHMACRKKYVDWGMDQNNPRPDGFLYTDMIEVRSFFIEATLGHLQIPRRSTTPAPCHSLHMVLDHCDLYKTCQTDLSYSCTRRTHRPMIVALSSSPRHDHNHPPA